MTRTISRSLILLAVVLLYCLPSAAHVHHVKIITREDVLNGKPFGEVGAYEKIIGKAFFTVDVANKHNLQIVDLDKADRNGQGEVEFSADFYILRPKSLEKSNGAMLLEISNRGGKSMISMLQRTRGSGNPTLEEQFGDGFLMERGYTLAWVGWQWDVPPTTTNVMRLFAPIAYGPDHKHITGLVRADFTPIKSLTSYPLSHIVMGRNGGLGYDVSDPDDKHTVLTVRVAPEGERMAIPRSQWRFGLDKHSVEMESGFEAGKIYEVVYVAQDPVVAGLGLAAVRDFVSNAKYDKEAIAPVKRAYAMGISQSGRFLRHFLYQDFNADEQDRMVLDGVLSHVAGAGRGSFNHRFAQPSRDAQPMSSLFYPTDLFPFTDIEETDPVSGLREGLLERTSHKPKIFYSNTSYEYWGRAGSLIHTAPDGKSDYVIPANVRIYYYAGLQHYTSAFPPPYGTGEDKGQQRLNSNPIVFFWRAMVANMDAWVSKDTVPPPSLYPKIDNGTLVERAKWKFPELPGVSVPSEPQTAYHLNFGSQFKKNGVVDNEPPIVGDKFTALVPQVDQDGNEISGVRLPQLEVPLATYTGWNLRHPEIGAPTQRLSLGGSYIPFAKSVAERQSNHDPRPSVAERYHDKEDYRVRFQKAAERLIQAHYIMADDLKLLLERGNTEWEEANNAAAAGGNEELPKGWLHRSSQPGDYEMSVDRSIVHGGQASLSVKSIAEKTDGIGNLMRTIEADTFRGKRVRMSGYVRSKGVDDWAGLWMRVDGSVLPVSTTRELLAFDNMQKRPIKGTTDWTKYEIVLDIPDRAQEIASGILLSGRGQVWLDDLQFEIVGNEIAVTSGGAEPDETIRLRSLVKATPRLPLRETELKLEPAVPLEMVSSVAVGKDGLIYILHRNKTVDNIIVTTPEGKVLRSWGKGQYTIAHSIRFDPQGNVWTTDAGDSTIRKYTTAGQELLKFKVELPAKPKGPFCGTTDIAFAPNDHLFVSDGYQNARVIEFTAAGERLREFGTPGTGPGQFQVPHGIAVDDTGRIYVADRENGRIQWFDSNGTYQAEWNHTGKTFSLKLTGDGNLWIGTQPRNVRNGAEGWIMKLDARTGTVLGLFESWGHSVEVTPTGEVLPGTGRGSVVVFRP